MIGCAGAAVVDSLSVRNLQALVYCHHFESGSRSLVVIGDAELSQLIRAPRGVPVVPVSAYGMFCRLQWARVCGFNGLASVLEERVSSQMGS